MTMTPFLAADVGRQIQCGAGLAMITARTDANNVTATIEQAFPALVNDAYDWTLLGSPMTQLTPGATGPIGATITLTLAAAGWREEDVGKYVEINGGLVRISVYTSVTVCSGIVEKELASVVDAPALAWRLMASVWGGINGYPSCGTFYGQRLWLAGSPGRPQDLWGSVIAEFFDFLLGVEDTDALSYKISSDQVNTIRHLSQTRGLVALTYGGEFSIKGGQEKPITPTNIDIKDQSVYGCTGVQPVRVGNEIYFVQRAKRKIRALAPTQFDADTYASPDISVLSEHITETGVVDMAFCAEPESVVHICRADGVVATLTADRDQDVFAFARQITQGRVQSVEAIPVEDGYRLFAAVRRVVNGASHTYIEMLTPGRHTDCSITGHSDVGATVWGGLGHLEGAEVIVKGDGVNLQKRIVAGGSITTERPVFDLEVGLQYNTRVRTLRPEIGTGAGTSQAAAISIHSSVVRLRDTTGCTINNQQLPFKHLGQSILDQPPPSFTGDKEATLLGWETGEVLIEQRLPYDFHLLAVIQKVTVNQG